MKTERQNLKKTLLRDGDYKSTKDVFLRLANLQPETPILANLNEDTKEIVYHTSKEVLADIEKIGNAFLRLGLKDKHFAILSDNSYEYIITDMAIVGGLGVVTPMDKDANEELLTTLLSKCETNVVVCSSYELVKLNRIKDKCESLETFITIDQKVEGYLFLKELMENETLEENAYRALEIDDEKTCQLLCTSGTTGPNKVVEIWLVHRFCLCHHAFL